MPKYPFKTNTFILHLDDPVFHKHDLYSKVYILLWQKDFTYTLSPQQLRCRQGLMFLSLAAMATRLCVPFFIYENVFVLETLCCANFIIHTL